MSRTANSTANSAVSRTQPGAAARGIHSHLQTTGLVATHLRSGMGATITVAVVVAVLAALAVFAPLAVNALLDASTQYRVAALSPPVRDTSSSLPTLPRPGAAPAPTESLPDEYRDTWGAWDSGLRDILTKAPASIRATHGEAQYFTRVGAPHEYASTTYLQFDPRYASRIEVIEGRLPERTATDQEWADALVSSFDPDSGRVIFDAPPLPAIEVVLSTAAADKLQWKIGETREIGAEAQWMRSVPLTLVGTFEAVDPADPYWTRATGVLAPSIGFTPDGVEFVRTTAFAPPEIYYSVGGVGEGWITDVWYPVDPGEITARSAPTLLADLRGFIATTHEFPGFTLWGGITFQSSLIATLQSTIAQNASLVSALAMLAAGPVGVALAVLVLGCRLMREHRRPALDLLGARGASPGQLRALLGLEGLLAGVVPAAVGAAAGVALGVFALPGGAPPTPLLFVAPVVLALLPAGVSVATADRVRGRERADAPLTRSRWRPVFEGVVVLLAALATVLLLVRGTDATATTVDLLAVAAPLLLSLVACIVTLRIYPVVLRVVLARERSGRGFVGMLGAARALRDPATGLAPVLALIVGVSFAVASGILLSIVQTGAVESARGAAGSDVQLSANRFDDADVDAVGAVDGVAAVAPVGLLRSAEMLADNKLSRVSLYLADRELLDDVQQGFPHVVPADVDLGDGTGMPQLLFSAAEAARTGAADAEQLRMLKAYSEFAGTVRGTAPFATNATWVLADSAYVEQISDDAPMTTRMLVRVEEGMDAAAVADSLRDLFPAGVRVTTADETLAAIEDDPAFAGLRWALIVGIIASAALSAVAVVVTLVLGARPRRRILALLQTLGAPPRSALALVAWELVPVGVTALVVGGAFGALLPVLLASVIDLRPFTTGVDPPGYSADPLVLLLTVGGFVVVTALVTVAALFITRRARAAAVLRTVEES